MKKQLSKSLTFFIVIILLISNSLTILSSENNKNGYKSSPLRRDIIKIDGKDNLYRSTHLPIKYDLRDGQNIHNRRVTPIRDQGQDGVCWIFGALASVETALLNSNYNEYWDFSENHMKHSILYGDVNKFGFNLTPSDGGNYDMAAAYLTRWDGLVREEDDPYSYLDDVREYPLDDYKVYKHIQNIIYIPDIPRGSEKAGKNINEYRQVFIKNVKELILETGAAVATSYYSDLNFLNKNGAYYYNLSDSIQNHGVAIVGWDDNYSKNNFKIKPPYDGAWIIKNSWGSSVGDEGYIYVSYYDTSFGKDSTIFLAPESNQNYDKQYLYDPFGRTGYIDYGKNIIYGANKFYAQGSEKLKAVSLFINNANTTCTIYVDNLVSSKNSVDKINGKGVITKTFKYPGYYTINLLEDIPLDKGYFTVYVKLEVPKEVAALSIEQNAYYYDGTAYLSNAKSNYNEGFISADGNYWYDLKEYDVSLCLRAFTDTNEEREKDIYNILVEEVINKEVFLLVDGIKDSSGTLVFTTFDEDKKIHDIFTKKIEDGDMRFSFNLSNDAKFIKAFVIKSLDSMSPLMREIDFIDLSHIK